MYFFLEKTSQDKKGLNRTAGVGKFNKKSTEKKTIVSFAGISVALNAS